LSHVAAKATEAAAPEAAEASTTAARRVDVRLRADARSRNGRRCEELAVGIDFWRHNLPVGKEWPDFQSMVWLTWKSNGSTAEIG
jgi:hypothetical protein